MAHIQPFEFRSFNLQDFNAPLAPKKPVLPDFMAEETMVIEEPKAPSFSEQELEAARAEAYVEGLAKGKEEAQTTIDYAKNAREEVLALAVNSLAGSLEQALERRKEEQAKTQADMAKLALMMAQKIAGNAMEDMPLAAIQPMVEDCLNMLGSEERVKISLHPDLVEMLQEKLALSPSSSKQIVDVVGNPELAVGDCRIEWHGGKAERNTAALWKEMEAVIARAYNTNE